MATAYKFYRLWLTKNSSADLRYYCINTWKLYESADLSGLDVAPSGVMTSSGIYSSQLATYANDGNDSTYWESDNRVTAGSNAWLKVELPSAMVIRSMSIYSSSQTAEKPRDFILQGSNDNSAWDDIAAFVDFMSTSGPVTRGCAPWLQVRGVSKLDNGSPSSKIFIHKWDTGDLLGAITPAPDGSFSWNAPDGSNVMVTHIGPSGYRPLSDGPITPAEV